jgi:hypothetical protein
MTRKFAAHFRRTMALAGADESVRLAAEYVKQRLSKLFTLKPEIIEGPIKAHD